jgi:hypothetical protein
MRSGLPLLDYAPSRCSAGERNELLERWSAPQAVVRALFIAEPLIQFHKAPAWAAQYTGLRFPEGRVVRMRYCCREWNAST